MSPEFNVIYANSWKHRFVRYIFGMMNPDARVDEFCHNDDKLKCFFFFFKLK